MRPYLDTVACLKGIIPTLPPLPGPDPLLEIPLMIIGEAFRHEIWLPDSVRLWLRTIPVESFKPVLDAMAEELRGCGTYPDPDYRDQIESTRLAILWGAIRHGVMPRYVPGYLAFSKEVVAYDKRFGVRQESL